MHSLRAFADRDGLTFPLLSDFWPHGEVAAGFGALDEERGCARRSTFLLDGRRRVRWALHHPMGHARDPADLLRAAAAVTRPGTAAEPGRER